ncbi:alpha/beta hydrolase-fold protein [Sphingobacterium wenxiniae]|uniref:Enterochelin esterase n=1 Tax=Sphingobacterium wenxiniae TaxID=683125 RepID=A0A1I6UT43_9SPHI|nr:alpha/beta hydrolase-fold protein [Sphingobacterium wenxiniae]SFT04601.1 enterochelin esterase [Sphingobacterium wenxiniae]
MLRKSISIVLSLGFWAVGTAQAQENIGGNKTVVQSPVVHEDNAVTIRLAAKTQGEVYVIGNWMSGGKEKMLRDSLGLYYTTPSLSSDLYMYNLEMDGVVVNDPLNVYIVRDVANTFNYFLTKGAQADFYQIQDVPHGTVAKRWYDSPTLGMTRRMTVYTPAGYEQSEKALPVLYLLHGMGGDEEAWATLGRATQILDNMIAQGKVKPMIVVMPNGHVSNAAAPGESAKGQYPINFFTPDVGSGKMEESFMDIVQFVESNYRVKKEKSTRAIAGLSMGGSHTLFTSAYLNNHFDYVGLFSAAFRMNDKVQSPVFSNFEQNLAKQRDNGYKLYWIGMGKEDFLYKVGEDYRKRLDAIGMKYTYRESEGGHTWSNWRLYLTEFLPLLF